MQSDIATGVGWIEEKPEEKSKEGYEGVGTPIKKLQHTERASEVKWLENVPLTSQ